MSDLFVMQRANGDLFALDDHGRFRVPLFHSSYDAMMARLRNFGMLLFKPVILDARVLEQIVPQGTAADVDFWLVNDPLININRGRLLQNAQVASLVENRMKPKSMPGNATTEANARFSRLPESNGDATATWEDEGGRYSKMCVSVWNQSTLGGNQVFSDQSLVE